MKKALLLITATLLLSACSPEELFSMLAQSEVEQASKEAIEKTEKTAMSFEDLVAEKSENFDKTAKLVSVIEDGSYGTALISNKGDSGLDHQVWAVLPPLTEDGAFYEGWLVDPSNSKFFSTGPMKLYDDGVTRYLEFYSNVDFPTYTQVVITKELVNDRQPEAHIIEGDFKN